MTLRLRIGILVALMTIAGDSPGAEGSPKERAKQILALRSAAEALKEGRDGLVEDAEGKSATLVEDELHDAMLSSPADHAAQKPSADLCRKLVGESAQRSLEALEQQALTAARGHSPLPVTREALFEALGTPADTFYKTSTQEIVKRHADPLYKRARKRAVERQLRETSLRVGYPTQGRTDALLEKLTETSKTKPGSALKRSDILKFEPELQHNLGLDKLPLFDEVKTRLRQLALQVLGGIGDQYEAQIKAVDVAAQTPEAAAKVASERIAPELTAAAEQETEQRRNRPNRDEAVRIYDVFTCVERFAQEKAKALEKSALMAFTKESWSDWPGESDVDTAVRADINQHRDRAKSLAALKSVFRAPARKHLATAYLAARNITGPDAESLQSRLVTHLSDDKACRDAFEKMLETSLAALSNEVRSRIASEQAAPLLTELNTVERLEDKIVDWLSDTEELRPFKALEEARAFLSNREGLGASQMPSSAVLREAEEQLLARINALVEPAAAAHAKQKSLIMQLARSWKDDLKESIAAGVPLTELRKTWRTEVDDRYGAFVEKRDLVYATLFPSNEAELEKILRQHYESLKKEVQAQIMTTEQTLDATQEVQTEQLPTDLREKQAEVPEEEEKEAASDSLGESGVSEQEQALAFARRAAVGIVLRDVDEKTCELVVSYGELDEERSIRFEPGTDDKAIEAIVAGLDPETLVRALGLKRPKRGFLGLRRKHHDPVEVVVLAQSRLVRYRTMVRVREHLAELLADHASKSGLELPELDWSAASETAE